MRPGPRKEDKQMEKADLREILDLVKEKLGQEPEAACGIFWPDFSPTTRYAVGEEDVVVLYGIQEE